MTARKDSKLNGENYETTTYNFPEFARGPAPKKSIAKFFYDSSTGQILSRTASSWGKLISFYLCFYIVLSALFAICLQTLFCTLNYKSPKWQLDKSLIGTNPGLGFRPISNETEQGSLIWYESNDIEHLDFWVNLTNTFLAPYTEKNETLANGKKREVCSYDAYPKKGEVCSVPMDTFGNCTPSNKYSFGDKSPCIFLKLNRIFNWIPEYYNDTNDLHKDMPAELVRHIKSLQPKERNQVWVSCKGEYPSDVEAISTDRIEYSPRGFPGYYYPYDNEDGYLSPLVAVRFVLPVQHRIINIECRAWAKNIIYSGSYRDRQGSIHFELMID